MYHAFLSLHQLVLLRVYFIQFQQISIGITSKMVTRKQAQKGRELSQTRASRLCFISTSSDTASDPVLNNDTRQGTSNDRRAGPKRAAANRAVPGRAAKRRASQKSSWTESERQQECTDLNDNGSRRNEPDDPSKRFIVDCHDEVGVALDPSGSIAPADASERERQEAVNPSADEINNLKRKVWELEEQLSKSNGRLIAVLDRHEEQVKELKRSVCQKSATIALLESCQSSVSKSSGQNPLTEVDEEYRPMMNKIRGQLRAEADDFAREVVTYDRKVIRDWRGKVEKVSGNEEEELLIDLFGEKAFVAKCPMRLASEGEFFTKPAKQQQLLQEIIKSFVHEDIGMNEQEKIRCISRLSRTKYLTQWWGRVLSEQHSKCKTAFISTFLGALGYHYIRKNIKPKPDQISEVMNEQKHARSTLRLYDENERPKFDY